MSYSPAPRQEILVSSLISTWTWRPRECSVPIVLYRHLRRIGHVRKYLTTEAAEQLVHSFVTSELDNGNSLSLYGLTDILLAKLQSVQNTPLRYRNVSPIKPLEQISPVLQKLHWLPVKQRVAFKILTLTFKASNGLAPEYLSELVHHYQPQRTLRSSSQPLLPTGPGSSPVANYPSHTPHPLSGMNSQFP